MPHPYYPENWLDRKEASDLLEKAKLPKRINRARCKRDGIEMSGDFQYVRKSSLEYYINWKTKELEAYNAL